MSTSNKSHNHSSSHSHYSSRTQDPHHLVSPSTRAATIFALSTLVTMGVLGAISTLVKPMLFGFRALPDLVLPTMSAAPEAPDSTGAICSLAFMYVMARLTRNATLESDKIINSVLRHLWILLFEALWVCVFAVLCESTAAYMAVTVDHPVNVMGSWGASVAIVALRCLFARHDHHSKHTACEALRLIGLSTIACVLWATVPLLMPAYGVTGDPSLLLPTVAIALLVTTLVAGPCLVEGRHGEEKRGHSHSHRGKTRR